MELIVCSHFIISNYLYLLTDRDHLNTIFQICGTPDEEMMGKIDSEDVSHTHKLHPFILDN